MTKRIVTIGDSHSKFGWEQLKLGIELINYHVGPRTLFGFLRDNISLYDFKIDVNDIIILSFGEIDCRCHIKKHSLNRSYIVTIDDLLEDYYCYLKKYEDLNIILYGLLPPSNNFGAEGSELERIAYYKYFNEKIKNICDKLNFKYFDIYDEYKNDKEMMRHDLSDGTVHIKDNIFLREKFISFLKNNYSIDVKPTKIFDTFMFFNELDILEIRLAEMYDIVDKFILIENKKTHQNKEKELVFEKNKERFNKYIDKIEYIVTDISSENSWEIETTQRMKFLDYLKNINVLDTDLVIVSDVDEIPSKKSVEKNIIYVQKNSIVKMKQDMYRCKLNLKCGVWHHGFISTYSYIKNKGPADVHNIRAFMKEKNIECGWHFSWLKIHDTSYEEKIKAYAHSEYNNTDGIKQLKESFLREDILEVTTIENHPIEIKNNLEVYKKYLHAVSEENFSKEKDSYLIGKWFFRKLNEPTVFTIEINENFDVIFEGKISQDHRVRKTKSGFIFYVVNTPWWDEYNIKYENDGSIQIPMYGKSWNSDGKEVSILEKVTYKPVKLYNTNTQTSPFLIHNNNRNGTGYNNTKIFNELISNTNRPNIECKDVLVFTYYDKINSLLENCCQKIKLPIFIDTGVGYIGHKQKLLTTKKVLQETNKKYICWMDAVDCVVLNGNFQNIIKYMEENKCKILFSSECNNFPDVEREFELSVSKSKYAFLCAGMYIAEVDFTKRIIDECLKSYEDLIDKNPNNPIKTMDGGKCPLWMPGDQYIWKIFYKKYYPEIQVDTQCLFFQNLFKSDGDIVI